MPVDAEKLEIVTYHNRDFQRYALDSRIYFAPVDEVSGYSHIKLADGSASLTGLG